MDINIEMLKFESDIYKTFSNPYRMHIIRLLYKKEMSASDLIKETGLSKANLSQHMSALVGKNAVNSTRKGVNVFYSLSDRKIGQACNLMQEVIINNIRKNHKLIKKML